MKNEITLKRQEFDSLMGLARLGIKAALSGEEFDGAAAFLLTMKQKLQQNDTASNVIELPKKDESHG